MRTTGSTVELLPAKFARVSAPDKLVAQETGKTRIFSAQEARQSLEWLLFETRKILQKTLEDNPKDIANAFRQTADISNAPLHGRCSFSQAVSAYALSENGLEPKNFSLQSMKDSTIGHASLTVEINQDTGPKLYLIDPTYRQFYDPEHPVIEDKNIPMPGFILAANPAGTKLLESLLTDGFAELNPETAEAYISSFHNGKSPFQHANESFEFLRDPPRDQMGHHMDKTILGKMGLLIPNPYK